ncbi:hypothetical protein [Thermodesulfitimonas autotrophica]|uniref:hypothetical protein n=1 Tax=Thermodesulfitimonas autotrophica TaxID=1894989 RepID=UPI002FE31098
MARAFLKLGVLSLLLLGLPLLGVKVTGGAITPYLSFPPATRDVTQPSFSWVAFFLLALLPLATAALYGAWFRCPPLPAASQSPRPGRLPWWGVAGLFWLGCAWVLAWTRFPWFAPWQRYTFSPLWLGYIVVVNALTFRRTGRCLLTAQTGYFLALFPLSAFFWWYFEYLNRFVANWYYVGLGELGPLEYFLLATPPFATVLPAVLSTAEWLASYPFWGSRRAGFWAPRIERPRCIAGLLLLFAAAGLAGLGIWPRYLFPLLWLAPLAVIISLQTLLGEETVFAPLKEGDWRPVLVPAAAGLVCGFFWEMWNYYSLARWEYAVPFVHRFQIFAMPLLGYAGYLPFGLECVLVSDQLARLWPTKESVCPALFDHPAPPGQSLKITF